MNTKQGCKIPIITELASIFFAMVLFTSSSFADDEADAKAKYKEGVRLFSDGKLEDALEAFETAYKIHPRNSILYNLGMCQMALFKYAEAITTFNKFLSLGKDKAKSKKVRKIKESLEKIKPMVGLLKLEAPPLGAEIQVNDKVIGKAPLNMLVFLDPGQYNVQVILDEHKPLRTTITIAAGAETIVRASLTKAEEPAPEEQPVIQEPESVASDTFKEVTPTDRNKLWTGLFIGSICSAGLGIVGIGIGGYFTYEVQQDIDEIDSLESQYQQRSITKDEYDKDYNKIADDKFPSDRTGMLLGYIGGSALIATGAVLFTLDYLRKDKENPNAVSVRPTLSGMEIRF